ncbi:MAG TPA: hydroxyisourate hydrolase [Abditibacterium sp.]|jgi:5-hydroxyisourate hydrolase
MSGLTTHILDTSRGVPAAGVAVRLEVRVAQDWHSLTEVSTDADGRARLVASNTDLQPGDYRLCFEVENYFVDEAVQAFFPLVQVIFRVSERRHYHVPLLLSPFGFSTYRGS